MPVTYIYGRYLECVTSDLKSDSVSHSVDAYLLEEDSFQISSRFETTEPYSFWFCLKSGRPDKKNKISSDMRSVPGLKITDVAAEKALCYFRNVYAHMKSSQPVGCRITDPITDSHCMSVV